MAPYIALAMFVGGVCLSAWGCMMLDIHDDRTGRRPGGYGSNESNTWPYAHAKAIGFLTALAAPIALLFGASA